MMMMKAEHSGAEDDVYNPRAGEVETAGFMGLSSH